MPQGNGRDAYPRAVWVNPAHIVAIVSSELEDQSAGWTILHMLNGELMHVSQEPKEILRSLKDFGEDEPAFP